MNQDCTKINSGTNELASEQTIERSEQCGVSESVRGVSERASGLSEWPITCIPISRSFESTFIISATCLITSLVTLCMTLIRINVCMTLTQPFFDHRRTSYYSVSGVHVKLKDKLGALPL